MRYTMSWHFHIIALQYIVSIAPYYNIIISSCFHIVILLIGKQETYHICLLSRIQLLSMMSAHKDLLWTRGWPSEYFVFIGVALVSCSCQAQALTTIFQSTAICHARTATPMDPRSVALLQSMPNSRSVALLQSMPNSPLF